MVLLLSGENRNGRNGCYGEVFSRCLSRCKGLTALVAERGTRKHANGEGSRPWKRPDGRFMAGLTEQTPAGPKRRWFYGRTAREANAKLKAALERRAQGLAVQEDRRTLGDYLLTWLDGVRPSLAGTTYARYEMLIRLHLRPKLGTIPLAKLTPEQIQRHYARQLAGGLSAGSVRGEYAVLHQALEQALRWGYIPRNPASIARPPRLARSEARSLSPEEARRFLAAARDDPLWALWTLALTTGMRQGELLALRWTDVDLEAGAVTVRASLGRRGELGEPKTHRQRRIDLIAVAIEALRAQSRGVGHAFVFPSPVLPGRPLTSFGANKALARLLMRAGLPAVNFHALRHSCATLLLSRGVPVPVVSQIMGHVTATQTLGTYAHVTPTMQGDARRELERFFGA